MEPHWHARRIKTLWVLILIGIAYSGLFHTQRTLTGIHEVDGILGVLLGLYICSYPAAKFVDMLFFRRGARRLFLSRQLVFLWLGLNMLVLLVGWTVIFIGATRFFSKMD